MENLRSRVFALICSALLLAACVQEDTPQEATQAFWQAVVANDAAGVVRHSTLADAAQYDTFGRDWQGRTPSFGKIVVEGDQATVATVLAGPGEATSPQFVTNLVRVVGAWKVDYAGTGKALAGGTPENALLIIDPSDPVSMHVGNYYKNARNIPDANVFYLDSAATNFASFSATNLEAVLAAITQRNLGDHADLSLRI